MVDFWVRVDSLLPPGCNLKWLCDEIGERYNKIINLRHRNSYPSLEIAYKIAQLLGTTVDYLYSGKEPFYTEIEKIPPECKKNKKILTTFINILKENDLV